MHDLDDPAQREATRPESAEPPAQEGDDDPLIVWFLSLTPTERVEVAQDFVDSARLLRDGLRS
jgi:hypothetical protein